MGAPVRRMNNVGLGKQLKKTGEGRVQLTAQKTSTLNAAAVAKSLSKCKQVKGLKVNTGFTN